MIDRINIDGLLEEMRLADETYFKQLFRNKVLRVYNKCLLRNKLNLATRIASKYREELTEVLRSDLCISSQYALFAANVLKEKK